MSKQNRSRVSKKFPPVPEEYCTVLPRSDLDIRVMLDSGAYSAWSSGVKIDLGCYADFIQSMPLFDVVVSLDVIPGNRGGPRLTTLDLEEAAKQSWRNYQWLCRRGIEAIPTFHMGESWKWLERIVKESTGYIGLGGTVRGSRQRRRDWLDSVFTRLTDVDGVPRVKVHGFGISDRAVLTRYPWYSCDSITWLLTAAYGLGSVSGTSVGFTPQQSGSSGYFEALSEVERAYILKSVGGVEDLGAIRAYRIHQNCRDFFNWVAQLKTVPFSISSRHSSVFLDSGNYTAATVPELWESPRFYFGVDIKRIPLAILNLVGVSNRLFSYCDVGRMPADIMSEYMNSGTLPERSYNNTNFRIDALTERRMK